MIEEQLQSCDEVHVLGSFSLIIARNTVGVFVVNVQLVADALLGLEQVVRIVRSDVDSGMNSDQRIFQNTVRRLVVRGILFQVLVIISEDLGPDVHQAADVEVEEGVEDDEEEDKLEPGDGSSCQTLDCSIRVVIEEESDLLVKISLRWSLGCAESKSLGFFLLSFSSCCAHHTFLLKMVSGKIGI